jgi:hypothetical protein
MLGANMFHPGPIVAVIGVGMTLVRMTVRSLEQSHETPSYPAATKPVSTAPTASELLLEGVAFLHKFFFSAFRSVLGIVLFYAEAVVSVVMQPLEAHINFKTPPCIRAP